MEIERNVIIGLCRTLGHNPDQVKSIVIFPHQVFVTAYAVDEAGKPILKQVGMGVETIEHRHQVVETRCA